MAGTQAVLPENKSNELPPRGDGFAPHSGATVLPK